MAEEFGPKFIEKAAKLMREEYVNRMDKVALNVHNKLVEVTPVDFGVARRGWNFTLNVPDKSVPERPDQPELPPPPPGPDKQATLITDRYFLTNAVPYIVRLNEGHSTKAGAHFVEAMIVSGVSEADNQL